MLRCFKTLPELHSEVAMYRYLLLAAFVLTVSNATAGITASGHISVNDGNTSLDIGFSNHDKSVIAAYYQDGASGGRTETGRGGKHGKRSKRGRHVPPGLAKKGGLPPGIAKRDRLPAEVVTEVLPAELERKLSPLPSPNYVRVKVGQDLVIMDKRTRVVLDVAFGLGN
jgi:hypothetical protein